MSKTVKLTLGVKNATLIAGILEKIKSCNCANCIKAVPAIEEFQEELCDKLTIGQMREAINDIGDGTYNTTIN